MPHCYFLNRKQKKIKLTNLNLSFIPNVNPFPPSPVVPFGGSSVTVWDFVETRAFPKKHKRDISSRPTSVIRMSSPMKSKLKYFAPRVLPCGTSSVHVAGLVHLIRIYLMMPPTTFQDFVNNIRRYVELFCRVESRLLVYSKDTFMNGSIREKSSRIRTTMSPNRHSRNGPRNAATTVIRMMLSNSYVAWPLVPPLPNSLINKNVTSGMNLSSHLV